ncbi:hypothetical protein JNUCC1_02086 [Lentibacillus sp. JNUCC-1]|uniref:RNA polymerase sigma factor n=1 Tax=Lentibacillus sp. JNUCC-1 TaxID=2654513 RepID=UPI0013250D9B|nr:RNA polymerase sigma factor [Lentibacillus sp. JNUCC-1]MUV38250.1 hypothetical protein [Lentibacillus sp. JNUCC-1]
MDEEEIISRVKGDDEHAFAQLVDEYKPVIERFAFQFGIDFGSVADVVQETFIKIHRHIHRFKKGKFSTWVYKITLNVARDHHRKNKRQQRLWERVKKNYPQKTSTTFFEKAEHVRLHECLQQLDEKYKTPLILYYFHDQSYEDIAFILKIKLSVVKTRLHRGKGQLRHLYTDLNGEVESHGQ